MFCGLWLNADASGPSHSGGLGYGVRGSDSIPTAVCKEIASAAIEIVTTFFIADYSQYEEWMFMLQVYSGLMGQDFDLVLQQAQMAI